MHLLPFTVLVWARLVITPVGLDRSSDQAEICPLSEIYIVEVHNPTYCYDI